MNLLRTILDLDTLSAAELIVEIGTDMNAFGSAAKFSMWAQDISRQLQIRC